MNYQATVKVGVLLLAAVALPGQTLQPERFVKVTGQIRSLRAVDATHVVAIMGKASAIQWDAVKGGTQFLSNVPLSEFKPLDPVALNFKSPFIFQSGGPAMRMIVKPERERQQVLIVERGCNALACAKWKDVHGDAAVDAYLKPLKPPARDPRDTKTQVAVSGISGVGIDGASFYVLYACHFKDNTASIGKFVKVNGTWKRSMIHVQLPDKFEYLEHVAARSGRIWIASEKMIVSYREVQ